MGVSAGWGRDKGGRKWRLGWGKGKDGGGGEHDWEGAGKWVGPIEVARIGFQRRGRFTRPGEGGIRRVGDIHGSGAVQRCRPGTVGLARNCKSLAWGTLVHPGPDLPSETPGGRAPAFFLFVWFSSHTGFDLLSLLSCPGAAQA